MKIPRISVIIPTLNRAEFLDCAVMSVLASSGEEIELLVVDDGSDPPVEGERISRGDPRVQVLRHETTKGAPAARNTGLASARGEFVLFLDDDDELNPGAAEKLLEGYSGLDERYGVVFAGHVRRYKSGKERVFLPEGDGVLTPQLLESPVYGKVSLIRKSALLLLGGFDESLINCQDWDLHLRLSEVSLFRAVKEALIIYRIHSDSISQDLGRRLDGVEVFLRKHAELYEAYPEILKSKLKYLGLLALALGYQRRASEHLMRARRLSPLPSSASLYALLTILPTSLSTRVALSWLRASGSIDN